MPRQGDCIEEGAYQTGKRRYEALLLAKRNVVAVGVGNK